jgi:Icc protein
MSNVRFAHITDTHISPAQISEVRGRNAHEYTRAAVRAVNHSMQNGDFVVHTGDVTADPGIGAAAPALEILSELRFPLRALPGNHDCPDEIRMLMEKLLQREPDPSLCWRRVGEGRMPYVFEVRGHTFVALDAVPAAPYYGGRLPSDQLDIVRTLLSQGVPSLTLFVHYPTLPSGVPWIDEKMLLWNGAELHEVLRAAAPGVVKGVFSGHVHHPMVSIEDGVLYASAPSTLVQFSVFPELRDDSLLSEEQPGYALVDVCENRTRISQQRLNPSTETHFKS